MQDLAVLVCTVQCWSHNSFIGSRLSSPSWDHTVQQGSQGADLVSIDPGPLVRGIATSPHIRPKRVSQAPPKSPGPPKALKSRPWMFESVNGINSTLLIIVAYVHYMDKRPPSPPKPHPGHLSLNPNWLNLWILKCSICTLNRYMCLESFLISGIPAHFPQNPP